MSNSSELPNLPLNGDLDAVREFYAERGMDYDKLGPRQYARWTTFEQEAHELEEFDFVKEYEALLARRRAKAE